MEIKVLGTRGEIEESAPYHAKKSGILIDNTLLLDVGDERFLRYNPRAILITHLHPDHAYFVRHREIPETEAQLYAPEKYDSVKLHITDSPFSIDEYHITPLPTVHSIKVKSNAYLVEHEGKRILYTGDMLWIDKKYRDTLGKLDLVITEASYMRKAGMVRRHSQTGQLYGHTGVPDLIMLFKDHTNTILFVHFGAWFYKDIKHARAEFKALAREYDRKLIVGYDGLTLTL